MFNRNIKKSILFVFLAFLFSWGVFAAIYFGGFEWAKTNSAVLIVSYMFGPLLSAFIVQKIIYKEDFAGPLGISIKINGWFISAFLIPLIIVLGAFAASMLFNNVYYTPDMSGLIERSRGTISSYDFKRLRQLVAISGVHPIWREIARAVIAGGSVFAFVAFGSEAGWRGFLYKEIGYFGFWRSSVLIGIIWGIWNIPLALVSNYNPRHFSEGIIMMAAFYILLSPVLTYIRVKAKSAVAPSVICGIIYYCRALNIDTMLIGGGSDLTVGVFGLSGFIVLGALNLLLFIYNNLILKMQYRVL